MYRPTRYYVRLRIFKEIMVLFAVKAYLIILTLLWIRILVAWIFSGWQQRKLLSCWCYRGVGEGGGRGAAALYCILGMGMVPRGNAHHQYRALSREISSSSAEIEQKSVSSVFLMSSDNVSSIVLGCHRDMHRQSWRNCRLKRYNFSRVMSGNWDGNCQGKCSSPI